MEDEKIGHIHARSGYYPGIYIISILLTVIIYFTRETPRQILGAMVGGLAVSLLGISIDIIAYYNGWWYYPNSTTAYGSLGYYLIAASFYGAGVALIGWRVNRHFGLKVLIVFNYFSDFMEFSAILLLRLLPGQATPLCLVRAQYP